MLGVEFRHGTASSVGATALCPALVSEWSAACDRPLEPIHNHSPARQKHSRSAVQCAACATAGGHVSTGSHSIRAVGESPAWPWAADEAHVQAVPL